MASKSRRNNEAAKSPEPISLGEFGVSEDTKGIMKAKTSNVATGSATNSGNVYNNGVDEDGFQPVRKSKIKKNKSQIAVDQKAAENALEFLTSTSPRSPTRNEAPPNHFTAVSPLVSSAPSHSEGRKTFSDDSLSSAFSPLMETLDHKERIAQKSSVETEEKTKQPDENHDLVLLLNKLTKRKEMLAFAKEHNIEIGDAKHTYTDADSLKQFITVKLRERADSSVSKHSESLPSLEGDSEDEEKKRNASFERLPPADIPAFNRLAVPNDRAHLPSPAPTERKSKKSKAKSTLVSDFVPTPTESTVLGTQPVSAPVEKPVPMNVDNNTSAISTVKTKALAETDEYPLIDVEQYNQPRLEEVKFYPDGETIGMPTFHVGGTNSADGTKNESELGKDVQVTEESEKFAKEWTFKHQLPEDMTQLAISVPDFRTFGASPSNPLTGVVGVATGDGSHIRFRVLRSLSVEGAAPPTPQSVYRRYRDFYALYLRLAHLFPLELLPSLPSSMSSTLGTIPSLTLRSNEFLQMRSRRLEAFLTCLLRIPVQEMVKGPDMESFLLRESEEFDELAVKYLGNYGQDVNVPPVAVTERLTSSLTSFISKFSGLSLGSAGTTTGDSHSVRSSPNQFLGSSASPAPEHSPSTQLLASQTTRGEISASYEALQVWIDDHGRRQERLRCWEDLVDALEHLHNLFVAQAGLLTQLSELTTDIISNSSSSSSYQSRQLEGHRDKQNDMAMLLSQAFEPIGVLSFSHALQGPLTAVGEKHQPQGCLKTAHQMACLLEGASDLHHRVTTPSNIQTLPADANKVGEVVMNKFNKLKRENSKASLSVVQEFARISLEQAEKERRRMEHLKQELLKL